MVYISARRQREMVLVIGILAVFVVGAVGVRHFVWPSKSLEQGDETAAADAPEEEPSTIPVGAPRHRGGRRHFGRAGAIATDGKHDHLQRQRQLQPEQIRQGSPQGRRRAQPNQCRRRHSSSPSAKRWRLSNRQPWATIKADVSESQGPRRAPALADRTIQRGAAKASPAKKLLEAQHLLEEQKADTTRIRDRLRTYGFSAEQINAIPQNKRLATTCR